MLETFTPAVCGSRKRRIAAQALFGGAAVVTAAAVGLVLGLAGGALGARHAVLAAAGLALVGAAREAGLLRFPLPQSRRQVPERWRFELPLPVWSSGYGAGLGAGLFTFQPVSTYWVAAAGALALARPLPAALCFSLYGAGRALMAVWPLRGADATAAVERLVARRGALVRANVVALGACAVLLALAPAAGGAARYAPGALDPAAYGRTVAWADQDGTVVVRTLGEPDVVVPNAAEPSVSRGFLAYVDTAAGGIRVIRWRTGEQVGRVRNVSKPSLAWPKLAFVQDGSRYRRIIIRNLVTNARSVPVRVKSRIRLGRPSLRNGRLAWDAISRSGSAIYVRTLRTGQRRTIAKSRISHLSNPSLSRKRAVWVDARSGVTLLMSGWTHRSAKQKVERVRSRQVSYWTTALEGRWAYFTRWQVSSAAADVYRRRL